MKKMEEMQRMIVRMNEWMVMANVHIIIWETTLKHCKRWATELYFFIDIECTILTYVKFKKRLERNQFYENCYISVEQ